MNDKPHWLTAHLDTQYGNGVRWELMCPYEGPRDCGILVPCKVPAHHQPSAPRVPEFQDRRGWERYAYLDDLWRDFHPNGPFHPGTECWVKDRIESNDLEPEYWLREMTAKTITGPIPVAVRIEGWDEDAEPILTDWKDPL